MKNVYKNEFISKLTLQISLFQEGFKILANATSLQEIGENFYHIIRGSLLITDLSIFFKYKSNSSWEKVFLKSNNNTKYLNYLDAAEANGNFGESTETAVLAFQKANGLEETGKIDSKTMDALDALR